MVFDADSLSGLMYVEIHPDDRDFWYFPSFGGPGVSPYKLAITYVDFEAGIPEGVTPAYADTDVIGRGEVYKHYLSTPAREVPVSFHFMVKGEGQAAINQEVIYPARWLEKLKYPVTDTASGTAFPPPSCILHIGSFLHCRVVVTGAEIQWRQPFDAATLLPMYAVVNCTFAVQRLASTDMGYRQESITAGIWV